MTDERPVYKNHNVDINILLLVLAAKVIIIGICLWFMRVDDAKRSQLCQNNLRICKKQPEKPKPPAELRTDN